MNDQAKQALGAVHSALINLGVVLDAAPAEAESIIDRDIQFYLASLESEQIGQRTCLTASEDRAALCVVTAENVVNALQQYRRALARCGRV